MAGYLIAEEGPLAGLTVRLEEGEEWTLGRDPDEVSLVLEDPMVSRRHVICKLTPEGYELTNLSSVNPVTQNGKVVSEPTLLKEGDILHIGSTFFRFSEKEPEPLPNLGTTTSDEEGLIEDQGDLSSVTFSSDSAMRWCLKVISGPNSGAEFTMHPGVSYILGKDPHLCDIVFQDLSVSRQHAKLSVSNDQHVSIEDLESRNKVLVNSEEIHGAHELHSQDMVSLGTTSFLVIDKQEAHETIFSQAPTPPKKTESEAAKVETPPENWKETIIPIKHLVMAAGALLIIFVGIAGTVSLFHTEIIETPHIDETAKIEETLKGFNSVQYAFNEAQGKLLLTGHVLTPVDKQELLYKIHNLEFVRSVEDSIVVDEYVWENINALLMTNPQWVGVSLYSPQPGKFVLRGYLGSLEEMQDLSDYMNLNFPYLDRLDNQVVVETNLETQIHSMLLSKGLNGVTFQITNGEVVLAGRVDKKISDAFEEVIDVMKTLKGVRSIKNFVILTTSDNSRMDITSHYKVTGYSKKDDENQFVVINGKILSVGEAIDGMEITEILPQAVLLEKDGLKFRINYNPQ